MAKGKESIFLGMRLSDGHKYRIDNPNNGYECKLFREGDTAFIYCGSFYTKKVEHNSIVKAAERYLSTRD